ncbi:hypothetical protein CCC_00931 [Paramagnetospirillum magnetotacticum MS-1]|uniref:Ribosomal protein S1 n=1 Tax=Paramagnetospirillum magnetotacticum MS-1 TaxID=272627 RepID=A0A0C2YT16_PARME|nr:DUF6489 family protein [Paramagnetospirillum magnetotacticum]KIL97870.1 hypothetical protein CCC_00931 [Paramagnetospirillum magnetotacticum MS-1]
MKITVDVDCTPDEARTFLGLPDVKPMQQAMMKQIQDQMAANLHAMEPETMLKVWLPAGVQGMEHLQKMFWSQFASGASRPKEK